MRQAQLSETEVEASARPSELIAVPAPSRISGQGGYTLIEVLIAVFLVGTVIVALAGGMLTMMRATASTTEQQRLEAGILNYTEHLRSQTYGDCASSYPGWSAGGVSGEVTDIRYWRVPSGNAWGAEPFADSCSTDLGRQLVDVVVRLDADTDTEATAQVVLRRDG